MLKVTAHLQTGNRVQSTVDSSERVEPVLPFVNAQGVTQDQWRIVSPSLWTAVPGTDCGTLSTRRVQATVDHEWCMNAT